jgi:hypothetical protein
LSVQVEQVRQAIHLVTVATVLYLELSHLPVVVHVMVTQTVLSLAVQAVVQV